MKISQSPVLFAIAARISCSAFAPCLLTSRKQISKVSYQNLDDSDTEKMIHWIEDSIKLEKGSNAQKGNHNSALDPASTTLPSTGHSTTFRKKWGIDNQHEDEYWFNSRIHALGNIGFLGAFHAAVAPFFTFLIDIHAYGFANVRSRVAEELSKLMNTTRVRVLDLCCGVGMSTRALQGAFPDAEAIIGVDTSAEMVSMARFITSHIATLQPWYDKVYDDMEVYQGGKSLPRRAYEYIDEAAHNLVANFMEANAERTPFPESSFNLVTVMYGFHEIPWDGRQKIVEEAYRLLQPGGVFAVIDIVSDYVPPPTMLLGEPYVLEYQKNIHRQLETIKGFASTTYKTIIPGNVGMWILQRAEAM